MVEQSLHDSLSGHGPQHHVCVDEDGNHAPRALVIGNGELPQHEVALLVGEVPNTHAEHVGRPVLHHIGAEDLGRLVAVQGEVERESRVLALPREVIRICLPQG